MEKKELSVLNLLTLTILPSAVSTLIYIAVGFFFQGVPALDLFLIVVMLTLFPFEIMIMLLANKKEYGKNWYVNVDNCIITVNAYSYTIITAHKEKK